MPPPAEVLAHYALGEEQDRLTSAHGLLELLRTQDILQRHLPPVPARILDVGGGPGVYAEWLAGLGYSVHLVDPVPLHVEQASRRPGVTASLGDARTLAAADSSCDVVLALGPLYHLPDRSQRLLAWREFGRVVVPGGLIVAAAISRYAAWNDVMRKDWLLREGFAAAVDASLRDGRHRNDDERPELFTTYAGVAASGPAADHVLAFDRGGAVTVATRLPVGLVARGGWGDTELALPAGRWRDLLTDGVVGRAAADVLATYPVALLVREDS